MRRTPPEIIDVDEKRFDEMLDRAEAEEFTHEDYQIAKKLIELYAHLTGLIGDKNTSIRRLRKLLFGAPTEDEDKTQTFSRQDAMCGECRGNS